MSKTIKSTRIIFLVILSTLLLIIANPLTVIAAQDGSGPYTINVKTVDSESKELVTGSVFKLLKTSNIVDDKEDILKEPVLVKPEGVDLNDDGEFKITKNTKIIIPKSYGKGLYRLVETRRAPGYYNFDGHIFIEFPVIKSGQFAENQSIDLEIPLNRVISGLDISFFSENLKGEMDNYKNPLMFELNYEKGPFKDVFKTQKLEYNETGVIIENLSEGEYRLKVTNLPDSSLIQPKGDFVFNISCNENCTEPELENIGYNSRESSMDIEELHMRLFLYRTLIVKDDLKPKESNLKYLVGENVVVNLKLDKESGEALVLNNYNQVLVNIPEENSGFKVISVDNSTKDGEVFMVNLKENKTITVMLEITDSLEGGLPITIEASYNDDVHIIEREIMKTMNRTYGSFKGEVKIASGLFAKDITSPVGDFKVVNISDDSEVSTFSIKDDFLEIKDLKLGSYKILFKGANSDKFKEVSAFSVNESNYLIDKNIKIITLKSKLITSTLVGLVFGVLSVLALRSKRNLDKRRGLDEKKK